MVNGPFCVKQWAKVPINVVFVDYEVCFMINDCCVGLILEIVKIFP